MRLHCAAFTAIALSAAALHAGPVEFGMAELQKAIEASKIPARARIAAEVWPGTKPDAFEIVPWRVSGGDLRGLMYGLLEASEQIRRSGKLTALKAEPAAAIRGVRIVLRNAEWERASLFTRSFWMDYFARLARARFNGFQLVLGDSAWQPPQIPYFFSIPFFERVEVDGLTPFDRGRNLDALKMITQIASDYAIDFTLGMKFGATGPAVKNLSEEFRVPYIRTALPHLLEEVPWIRAIAVHDVPEEILRQAVLPALESVGRLVTLEVPDQPALLAREMSPATRILQALPAGVAIPNLASLRPRERPLIRVVAASRWTDPKYVRMVASGIVIGQAQGFEVEGSMDLDTSEARLLYAAWGRLGYQPKGSIPEEEGAEAETIACAARVDDLLLPMRQLQECAVKLERSENNEFIPLGQNASVRVRLQMAKSMEEYYRATKHESALRAAFYSYRSAARTIPQFKEDVERLEKLIAALDPEQPFTPMPWVVPPPRPLLSHAPVPVAWTAQPLQIALNAPPNVVISAVRLHYRHLAGSDGFQTMESTAKQARFTIPASQLTAPGQLIYWMEVVHPTGVWRMPEERANVPVFVTMLNTQPTLIEEEVAAPKETKPPTAADPKKQK